MKTFIVSTYKVNICQDIEEWGKCFYDIPDDYDFSLLDNRVELESECMGFAIPEDNEIWIFVPMNFKNNDLTETIAHELGHLMKFDFNEYSPEVREEKKAEHYENFYKLIMRIRARALKLIIVS